MTTDLIDALATRLERTHLEPSDVARAARVAPGVVADLLARRRLPCATERRRLAVLLGVDPIVAVTHPDEEDLAC